MSSETKEKRARPGILVTVLATLGALALLSTFVFFLFIFLMIRSGGQVQEIIKKGPKIGVIQISGTITWPEPYLKAIKEFKEDKEVRAVIVRIDSPGGAVGASQEIYQDLKLLDQEKPVVASLCSVAASGGYYAALGARRIIADPGTVTGSIGVVMQLPNLGPLLKKIGVKTTVVKSGRYKDIGSITREMSDDERQLMQEVLDDVHMQFIEAVAKSRKLPMEKVTSIADGRVFTGRQALEHGLIDQLGNLSVAVTEATRLAGIKEKPYLVYPKKDKMTIIKELLEEGGAKSIARFRSGDLAIW